MKHLYALFTILGLFVVAIALQANVVSTNGITSIDTHHTITKVRTSTYGGVERIIASTYDGAVLCYTVDGTLVWENKLSGYMNHDIYCDDLDADGNDEVMVANADGSVYCLTDGGSLKWEFKQNNAPMYAVTSVQAGRRVYVVCGGYDLNHYYLDAANGRALKTIPSSGFSIEKPWGSNIPPKFLCTVNFLRKCKDENGADIIALHGVMHSMSTAGTLYLFKPLASEPYKTITFKEGSTFGSMAIDNLSDNATRLLFGVSSMLDQAKLVSAKVSADQSDKHYSLQTLTQGNIDNFGYRVVQAEAYKGSDNKTRYFILYGSRVVLTTPDNLTGKGEIIASKYAYNDLCKHPTQNTMILASAQSGGSCIHLIDLDNNSWKASYKNLQPTGNITDIIDNSNQLKSQLNSFKRPEWETERRTVYFMSDYGNGTNDKNINTIHASYSNPQFLRSPWINNVQDPKDWNRDAMANEAFRNRRDTRKNYSWTQSQVLNWLTPFTTGTSKGFSIWGGHGNDPYYYSLDTDKKMASLSKDGQQSVLIYPEMEGTGADFAWMMNDLIYPLADHCHQIEGRTKLYIRSKNIFWNANVYESHWDKLVSGQYADVFIPSMEETTDKTMELSISSRVGMWCSGAVNQWGGRCARDNASFDRLRQHSHQMLPNHFLRMMVYQISMGATFLDNFQVDQEYMSLLWYMIAKGLLYVPNRNELLSLNPVHLSMLHPDPEFLEDGTNVKWTTFYTPEDDEPNRVFSRLNGTWPGAATTEWDFSRYAAGVKDRRLNFLPSYNNGLVMMTPPADAQAPRGAIADHLHPIYRNLLTTYYTDGRNYYKDAKMSQSMPANTYYQDVERAIVKGAESLPITVDGEVAWVTAQSAPKHIRLTLIDGGYINPSEKQVTVHFNTIRPSKITNLATGQEIPYNNSGKVTLTVPCGLFLFLDVELGESFSALHPATTSPQYTVTSAKNLVKVTGAEGHTVTLVNAQGQVVNRLFASTNEIAMPSPSGVMMVCIDNVTKKTVVL